MSDRATEKFKWLPCPFCRTGTSFNSRELIPSLVICSLLRKIRRNSGSAPKMDILASVAASAAATDFPSASSLLVTAKPGMDVLASVAANVSATRPRIARSLLPSTYTASRVSQSVESSSSAPSCKKRKRSNATKEASIIEITKQVEELTRERDEALSLQRSSNRKLQDRNRTIKSQRGTIEKLRRDVSSIMKERHAMIGRTIEAKFQYNEHLREIQHLRQANSNLQDRYENLGEEYRELQRKCEHIRSLMQAVIDNLKVKQRHNQRSVSILKSKRKELRAKIRTHFIRVDYKVPAHIALAKIIDAATQKLLKEKWKETKEATLSMAVDAINGCDDSIRVDYKVPAFVALAKIIDTATQKLMKGKGKPTKRATVAMAVDATTLCESSDFIDTSDFILIDRSVPAYVALAKIIDSASQMLLPGTDKKTKEATVAMAVDATKICGSV